MAIFTAVPADQRLVGIKAVRVNVVFRRTVSVTGSAITSIALVTGVRVIVWFMVTRSTVGPKADAISIAVIGMW